MALPVWRCRDDRCLLSCSRSHREQVQVRRRFARRLHGQPSRPPGGSRRLPAGEPQRQAGGDCQRQRARRHRHRRRVPARQRGADVGAGQAGGAGAEQRESVERDGTKQQAPMSRTVSVSHWWFHPGN